MLCGNDVFNDSLVEFFYWGVVKFFYLLNSDFLIFGFELSCFRCSGGVGDGEVFIYVNWDIDDFVKDE